MAAAPEGPEPAPAKSAAATGADDAPAAAPSPFQQALRGAAAAAGTKPQNARPQAATAAAGPETVPAQASSAGGGPAGTTAAPLPAPSASPVPPAPAGETAKGDDNAPANVDQILSLLAGQVAPTPPAVTVAAAGAAPAPAGADAGVAAPGVAAPGLATAAATTTTTTTTTTTATNTAATAAPLSLAGWSAFANAEPDGAAAPAAALTDTAARSEAKAAAVEVAGGAFEHFESWLQKADAALPQAGAAPAPLASAAPAPALPTVSVPVPMNHPGWGEALGHQVLWLNDQGVQQAQIHIHPQDLGPITVHVHVEDDRASVSFTAQHAAAREALETSIPRLRELFAQEGLNLGQANVFAQPQQSGGRDQGSAAGQRGSAWNGPGADGVESTPAETVSPAMTLRRGLVDDYA